MGNDPTVCEQGGWMDVVQPYLLSEPGYVMPGEKGCAIMRGVSAVSRLCLGYSSATARLRLGHISAMSR